jgi:hypothetical protein
MKSIVQKSNIKDTESEGLIGHSSHPNQSSNCSKRTCREILSNETISESQMVINRNHVRYPITFEGFQRLCNDCQVHVYDWWIRFSVRYGCHHKITFELFELDLELSAAIYAMACSGGKQYERNRVWRDEIYYLMEANGAEIDRNEHPLYDIIGDVE